MAMHFLAYPRQLIGKGFLRTTASDSASQKDLNVQALPGTNTKS